MLINLNSIDNVKKFVGVASTLGMANVDLKSGRYIASATSIMGIFSLDLTKPIEIIETNLTKEQRAALVENFNKIIVK